MLLFGNLACAIAAGLRWLWGLLWPWGQAAPPEPSGPGPLPTPDGPPRPARLPAVALAPPAVRAVMLALHNCHRGMHDVAKLEEDEALSEAAALAAMRLAACRSQGQPAPAAPVAVPEGLFSATASLLAAGHGTAADAFRTWARSPGRGALLLPFTHAGFADAVAADGTRFWVAVYGRPLAAGPAPSAPAGGTPA